MVTVYLTDVIGRMEECIERFTLFMHIHVLTHISTVGTHRRMSKPIQSMNLSDSSNKSLVILIQLV